MPARQYFLCPEFLVSLSLSHQTRPGMVKHQVRLPKGNPTVPEASRNEGGDVTRVGGLMKLRRQAEWGLEWMQRRVCQGPKYGSWIRSNFTAAEAA